MGTTGKVCFYLTRKEDPKYLLGALCHVLQATRAHGVCRVTGDDGTWEQFCRDIGRPVDPDWTGGWNELRPEHRPEPDDDSDSFESLGTVASSDLAGLFLPDTRLSGSLGTSHWQGLDAAIRSHIPEEIHGGFVPSSLEFTLGWHDLWECMEHEVGQFYDRSWFSLRLFGNGCPNDWKQFRHMIFQVDEVVRIQREAERVLGPLKRCIFWC